MGCPTSQLGIEVCVTTEQCSCDFTETGELYIIIKMGVLTLFGNYNRASSHFANRAYPSDAHQ